MSWTRKLWTFFFFNRALADLKKREIVFGAAPRAHPRRTLKSQARPARDTNNRAHQCTRLSRKAELSAELLFSCQEFRSGPKPRDPTTNLVSLALCHTLATSQLQAPRAVEFVRPL